MRSVLSVANFINRFLFYSGLLLQSARNEEPSSRGAFDSGLASGDSGLQLNLEIFFFFFFLMILQHCRQLHIQPWSYAFWGRSGFLCAEAYEVGHRSDKRGVNLISDVLHSVGCGISMPRPLAFSEGYPTWPDVDLPMRTPPSPESHDALTSPKKESQIKKQIKQRARFGRG